MAQGKMKNKATLPANVKNKSKPKKDNLRKIRKGKVCCCFDSTWFIFILNLILGAPVKPKIKSEGQLINQKIEKVIRARIEKEMRQRAGDWLILHVLLFLYFFFFFFTEIEKNF